MAISSSYARYLVVAIAALLMLMRAAPASAVAVPAAPTGLAVSQTTTPVITWADNSNDEDGFSIERCTGACTVFGQIGTVGAGATTFTDTNAIASVNRYRVRAFNADGYSGYSNVGEVVLISTGEASASATATPSTGQAPLTVTFDGSASTALNGTITSWEWSFGDNQTASGAIVTHTYLTPGVYAASLKVSGIGGFGSGVSATGAVIVTVTAPPLVAPGDLRATAPVRGQIRLDWSNPVSAATTLAVERCKGSGCTAFTRIAVLPASASSFVDATVKRQTVYRYRLAASDGTATVYSNIASVRSR